ncbi:MAG: HlyC/CorC family transporter [Ruminococcus sp.]|uniref:hemolysin family protein n=1 Tax=Ruminococcus sp. TaxID=41978 RepID=UPI0025E59354|nr:hemolysin family protein [Ruminococcus sp.]MBO4865288.1 HlyC/CorC family transporter [Ruminococcus sp.]
MDVPEPGFIGAAVPVLCGLLTAFFYACECSAAEISDSRLKKLAETDKRAASVMKMLEHTGRFLNVNLIARTALVALQTACAFIWFFTPMKKALADMWGGYDMAAGICSGAMIILLITVWVGTVCMGVPKKLCSAGKTGENFLLRTAGIYRAWLALFRPIEIVSCGLTTVLLRIFGVKNVNAEEAVTEEEILMMVDAVNETGAIEESQAEMISNIFEFDDIEIGEVMTHRTEVAAIDESAPIREAVELAIESGFSRIPVYKDSIDDIQGVIYAKDLLTLVFHESAEDRTVKDFMREVIFVPESQKCGELFKELTAKKIQMAVAVDEYGGTAGVVTLEDLIETIVGDIVDEFDDESEEITKISEGVFEIEGNAGYEDVMEALGKEPEEDSPFETIGAMVIELLGHIPDDGERASVRWENVKFTVMQAEDRRIGRIRAELCTE